MPPEADDALPVLGLTPLELARGGGSEAAREIGGQPRLWRDLAALLKIEFGRDRPLPGRALVPPLPLGGVNRGWQLRLGRADGGRRNKGAQATTSAPWRRPTSLKDGLSTSIPLGPCFS